MKKTIKGEYWRTLQQQKARAKATIERAKEDLREIEEKLGEFQELTKTPVEDAKESVQKQSYKVFYTKHCYDVVEATSQREAIEKFWNEDVLECVSGDVEVLDIIKIVE